MNKDGDLGQAGGHGNAEKLARYWMHFEDRVMSGGAPNRLD